MALMVWSTILAQAPDLGAVLAALRDSNSSVRMTAFYQLVPVPDSAADSTKLALIDLLTREAAFQRTRSETSALPDETYAAYFGDVIEAVAALKDPRSANALLDVIDTGDLATRTLASFGQPVLAAILAKFADADPAVRNGAIIAAHEMIELGVIADQVSKLEIESALLAVAIDANYYVGTSALYALADLAGVKVSPSMTRIDFEIRQDSSPSLNPRSNGVIVGNFLSSDSFNPRDLVPATVRLGRRQAQPIGGGIGPDVNRDGTPDLALRFRTQDTGLACGDTVMYFIGETAPGRSIVGATAIRTVGCQN